ncbi:MAG: type II 3-dehydroquinate dehydratase [Clostridia bacterium]|nr:type II 3-dehydroquinate dehydratase [Clostridia bacterium]
MKILVINGPNINMLGLREPEIYGNKTYTDLLEHIKTHCDKKNIDVDFFQSNHEGAIVDIIQEAFGKFDGIVINPAAYTHTSVAILDALKAVSIPTVEVHISNVDEREAFRKISYIRLYCKNTVSGLGFDSYTVAIDFLSEYLK